MKTRLGLLVGLFLTIGAFALAEDFGGYKGVKTGGTVTGNITFSGDAGIILQDGKVLKTTHDLGSGTLTATPTDVTGSRSLNVVYQNTTGAPLHVFVTASNGQSNVTDLEAHWGSTSAVSEFYGSWSQSYMRAGSIIVPSNYYYRFRAAGGSPQISLSNWVETKLFGGGTDGSTTKMTLVVDEVTGTARSTGTTYQNGPNWRYISASENITNGTLSLNADPSTNPPTTQRVLMISADWKTLSYWVPPGWYYKVVCSATCNDGAHRWYEADLTVVGANPAYAHATNATDYGTPSANTWTDLTFSTVDVAKGITISSGNITFARKGIYKFDLELINTDTAYQDNWIGVRLYNGTTTVATANAGITALANGGNGTSVPVHYTLFYDLQDTTATYKLQSANNNGTTKIGYAQPTVGSLNLPTTVLSITSVDSSTDGTMGNIVAWGYFTNGGSSPPTKAGGSSNISITRDSQGQYTLTFSPPLADGNYAIIPYCHGATSTNNCYVTGGYTNPQHTASQATITTVENPTTLLDFTRLNVQVVR